MFEEFIFEHLPNQRTISYSNCSYHIHHLNSLFQDLQEGQVHPGEPELEVGVQGGQGLQVIIHITFIILQYFSGFTSRGCDPLPV